MMVRKPSAFGLHITTEVYTNKSGVVYLNSPHNCSQEIFPPIISLENNAKNKKEKVNIQKPQCKLKPENFKTPN